MSKIIIRTLSVIAFIGIGISAVKVLPLVYEVGISHLMLVTIGYIYTFGTMGKSLISGEIG